MTIAALFNVSVTGSPTCRRSHVTPLRHLDVQVGGLAVKLWPDRLFCCNLRCRKWIKRQISTLRTRVLVAEPPGNVSRCLSTRVL